MLNYIHNPSGATATEEWLIKFCGFCQANKIRIFNDAAYAAMAFDTGSCLLSHVARYFPELSWAEAFSASKLLGNGTGWRIGAMVGSPDFIGDIKTIKGNTDSGVAGPMAAGALYSLEHDQKSIRTVVNRYKKRSALLCEILSNAGMQLAIKPRGGFFTLWKAPKHAFGREMSGAKDFNFSMIQNTGVVGVHFDPYIRYAVAYSDPGKFADAIKLAIARARVSY